MAEAGARKKIKTTLIVHPDHPDAQPTRVISNEAAQQLLDKFAPCPKARPHAEELDRERMQAERARDEEVGHALEAEVRRHLLAAADRPAPLPTLAAMLFVLARRLQRRRPTSWLNWPRPTPTLLEQFRQPRSQSPGCCST